MSNPHSFINQYKLQPYSKVNVTLQEVSNTHETILLSMSNLFSQGMFELHVDTTKWGLVEYFLSIILEKLSLLMVILVYGIVLLAFKLHIRQMKKKLKKDYEVEAGEEEESQMKEVHKMISLRQ